MAEQGDERRFGEFVVVRRHEYVAELALDRPKAMNAVSTDMARSITAACEALGGERDVRVVVLTSTAERAFCVGADLKERNSFSDADLVRQRPVARAAYTGVLELPMPTIAAVHGFALGGGFELALSCDLIVADRTAVLGLPEVSVGVIPGGGGTQLLPRRVGAARAAELIFSARRLEAGEARSWGSSTTSWTRAGTVRRPSRSPPASPPTPPSACAPPSARCGSGTGSTCARVWRSRTPPGGPSPSPGTAPRASPRSTRSASRSGRGSSRPRFPAPSGRYGYSDPCSPYQCPESS